MSSQSFALPGSNYGYTGIPVDDLETQDNTLVVAGFDQSGSTKKWASDMENCIKEIIKSCRSAADKLIYRQVQFDDEIKEFHGYKPLAECNVDDYTGCWSGGGTTNLYGASENIIDSIVDYAEQQAALHYNVNAIAYFLTDGAHYLPGVADKTLFTMEKVRLANQRAIDCEALESIMTICIGITGGDDRIRDKLRAFSNDVNFTQFIDVADADEKTLAKIANFISASVQSQSQALGSGGPSQSLTF